MMNMHMLDQEIDWRGGGERAEEKRKWGANLGHDFCAQIRVCVLPCRTMLDYFVHASGFQFGDHEWFGGEGDNDSAREAESARRVHSGESSVATGRGKDVRLRSAVIE